MVIAIDNNKRHCWIAHGNGGDSDDALEWFHNPISCTTIKRWYLSGGCHTDNIKAW